MRESLKSVWLTKPPYSIFCLKLGLAKHLEDGLIGLKLKLHGYDSRLNLRAFYKQIGVQQPRQKHFNGARIGY